MNKDENMKNYKDELQKKTSNYFLSVIKEVPDKLPHASKSLEYFLVLIAHAFSELLISFPV